jgi:hypothetical protein
MHYCCEIALIGYICDYVYIINHERRCKCTYAYVCKYLVGYFSPLQCFRFEERFCTSMHTVQQSSDSSEAICIGTSLLVSVVQQLEVGMRNTKPKSQTKSHESAFE